MKSFKTLFGKVTNVGGKFALVLKILDILAQIRETIKQLLKWVKRILGQLDRIEAKLDRVLECVDVDDPAKRRGSDKR